MHNKWLSLNGKIEPLRIYVAGPYTPKNCSLHDASRLAQKNTNIAVSVANALMAKGHYVFVPHLTHYLHIHETCQVNDGRWWYEMDNSFLTNWANALFYISPSTGADAELDLAKDLKLIIYKSLDEVEKLP